MKPTTLVVTTVHWPDDTRIRERLLRSLQDDFTVRYATRAPGPSDRSGFEWVELRGGRIRRNLSALRLSLRSSWDVLVVHDPELVPTALLARAMTRRPVVLDVHENVPATAFTRSWVPNPVRRPMAAALRLLLRVAESRLQLTLAEPGYRSLFRGEHPVFPNYPDTSGYPEPAPGDGSVVYLGDVTRQRGAGVAVEAAVIHGEPMEFIGRVSDELRSDLTAVLAGRGRVEFLGQVPNPLALERVRTAGVGISPLLDLPNYRDSMPTKILEYLALGIPVVASDLPGTRRLVSDLDAVELVAPGDPAALAAGVRRALSPSARDAALRQAPAIREQFRWPGDDVALFYRSLV